MSASVTAARALMAGRDRATSLVTILAVALPHAVLLMVVAGAMAFLNRDANPTSEIMARMQLGGAAVMAAILLVAQAATMGASAARLGMSRRSRDLAVLRLMGLDSGGTRMACVYETLFHAAIGVAIGTVLYVVTLPIWGLFTFQKTPLSIQEMWMGFLPMIGAGLGMLVIIGLSALVAVRRVTVTPLGVARRAKAHGISGVWVIVGIIAAAAWFFFGRYIFGLGDMTMVVAILAVVAFVAMALISLVGSWTLSVLGWLMARFGRKAKTVLAGRRLMDDPRSVWRSYGALAIVAFIAGIILPVMGLVANLPAAAEPEIQEMNMVAIADITTGMILTLGFAIILGTISTAVNQAIRAIDTIGETRSLLHSGAPVVFLDQSRRREVGLPAVVLIGGAMFTGLAMSLPAVGPQGSLWAAMWTPLMGVIGIVLVLAASEVAKPIRRRLLEEEQRSE
ncbi:MAG: ABC transporter permease [Actinomycetaceae bacterium]|nr:ABC transporter permease [Actinomycetaceae bacterium]